MPQVEACIRQREALALEAEEPLVWNEGVTHRAAALMAPMEAGVPSERGADGWTAGIGAPLRGDHGRDAHATWLPVT